ncbi:hypothetical protein PSP6_440168 [Paraburkholderia tropica]|nr:hypothetical protein PSP6_440168 [Paraburkholderia tropica]
MFHGWPDFRTLKLPHSLQFEPTKATQTPIRINHYVFGNYQNQKHPARGPKPSKTPRPPLKTFL